ncbi:MAG: peptidoglycan-associated outer membrane lipoprotein, partial [Symbiopectobacterium sp.]
MQFNNILKYLMLVLPVLAIAACTSHKEDGKDQFTVGTAGSDYENGNMSASKQTRLQMQELQCNNIVYFDLDKYDIRSDFARMLDAHAS